MVNSTHPVMLSKEDSEVYKSSVEIVEVMNKMGIATWIASLVPLGVCKG
jgi:tRNA-splicing ligase RtcB